MPRDETPSDGTVATAPATPGENNEPAYTPGDLRAAPATPGENND